MKVSPFEVSIHLVSDIVPTNGLEVLVMASGKEDKEKGTVKKVAGKMMETADKVTGNSKTEAKGKAQQVNDELQKGKAKEKAKK